MATAQGIRAGRAFVELFADDSKLVRGLRRASARLKAWGAGIRSIGMQVFAGGAAIAAPLLLALKQFTTAGDALDKMSSRVGASVEFLSALSHAAQIGGKVDSVEQGGGWAFAHDSALHKQNSAVDEPVRRTTGLNRRKRRTGRGPRSPGGG